MRKTTAITDWKLARNVFHPIVHDLHHASSRSRILSLRSHFGSSCFCYLVSLMHAEPAMQPVAKRAKHNGAQLVSLHHGAFVTQSGMVDVLKHVRDFGMPTAFSRASQYRARASACSELTPYGAPVMDLTMQMANGEAVQIAVQSPFAMLWKCANASEQYAAALRTALHRSPCSPSKPWGLLLYWDEVTPSNPLAKGKDLRKVQAIYWNFVELEALWSFEDSWFEVCTARSDLVSRMQGGMSGLVAQVMRLFFNPSGFDFKAAGIALSLHGDPPTAEPTRLFAVHQVTIADYPAITEVIGNRTHNASKPCCCCRNVVDHKTDLWTAAGTRLLPLTSLKVDEFKQHTDATVKLLAHRLLNESRTLGITAFKTLQQHLGWSFNPHSILYHDDLEFKPMSSLMFDWMHVWLIDGVFYRELRALMELYNEHHPGLVTHKDIHDYLQAWKWPKQVASAKSVCETGSFQGTASETLSCAQVLCKFFRDCAPHTAKTRAGLESFFLCCKCMDILSNAQRKASTPEQLASATHEFLDAHLRAYGSEYWAWKHHAALHLPLMWRKHGGLPNCFSLERKHKSTKRAMKDRLNTKSYEKCLIQDLTLQHIRNCSRNLLVSSLGDPHPPTKAVDEALREVLPSATSLDVSNRYTADNGGRIYRGDVVCIRSDSADGSECVVGQIWFHLRVDDCIKSCVSLWPLEASYAEAGCAKYRMCDRPQIIDSAALVCALLHKQCGTACTVVWPSWLRFAK